MTARLRQALLDAACGFLSLASPLLRRLRKDRADMNVADPNSHAGSYAQVVRPADVVKLEQESERLQREVRAAAVRNTMIARNTDVQLRHTVSFEERTRDTLRALTARMQQDDEQERR